MIENSNIFKCYGYNQCVHIIIIFPMTSFNMTDDFYWHTGMTRVNLSVLQHCMWYFNSLRPSDIYICISKPIIIGSDNGLSPDRRQAIIWTNAGILLIVSLGTNFSEILIEIHTFSFRKMHFKLSSAEWRPFCCCCVYRRYVGPVDCFLWFSYDCVRDLISAKWVI